MVVNESYSSHAWKGKWTIHVCSSTAICVDPANFWPKPKSANPKAVQMNLIMWLQLLLGFPFLAPRECSCYGERFFVMEYRDYLGYGYPYQCSSGHSAVPYVIGARLSFWLFPLFTVAPQSMGFNLDWCFITQDHILKVIILMLLCPL